MEQGAGFDVLEIEADRRAAAEAADCAARLFATGRCAEGDGEGAVGLVGHGFRIGCSANGEHGIRAVLACLDAVNRGCKIPYIQPLTERLGQRGFVEGDQGVFATLGHVHGDLGIGQRDHDLSFTLLAAPKIQALDAIGSHRRHAGFGLPGICRGGHRRRDPLVVQGHDDAVAVDPGLVLGKLGEFDHNPGSAASLSHLDRLGQPDADRKAALGRAIGDLGEIQRNAARHPGRENTGFRGRSGENQADVELGRSAATGLDAFQRQLGMGGSHQESPQKPE